MNPYDVWSQKIDTRANLLIENGFYIEAFYLYLTTIEFLTQDLILTQERWIVILLKNKGIELQSHSVEELNKKTLGELISIFQLYNKNSELVARLKNLNTFRRKIVHNLLSKNIDALNNEAKVKISDYHLLVRDMARLGMAISAKEISKNKRTIRTIKKKM